MCSANLTFSLALFSNPSCHVLPAAIVHLATRLAGWPPMAIRQLAGQPAAPPARPPARSPARHLLQIWR